MLRLAEIVKLFNVGRYADAIPLAQLELAIYEKVLGPNHLDVATSLNTLAFFYEKQGRYADAEPLYKRAAAIRSGGCKSLAEAIANCPYCLCHAYRNPFDRVHCDICEFGNSKHSTPLGRRSEMSTATGPIRWQCPA
jgi:tetratricopeptide (TPR) repeat protein